MKITLNDTGLNPIIIFSADIPNTLIDPNNINYFNTYFLSLYGNRKISSYIKTLYSRNLSQSEIDNQVRAIIASRFEDKWSRLWELWNKEYDPLQPFDITLTETSSDKLDTIKDKSTYIDNDSVYGFNSTEASPSDKSSGSTDREYARDITRGRDYSRKGNIGNITKQELVKQEREVLQYQIIDTIFKDIASVLVRASFGN